MSFIKLNIAFLVLVLFLLFQHSNLINIEKGGGYLYLGMMSVFATTLFLLDNRVQPMFRIHKSTIFLFLFLFYVILNSVRSGAGLSELKSVTIGTTGGIFFAIITGCMLACSLECIYYTVQKSKLFSKLSMLYILLTLLTGVVLLFLVFKTHYGEIRSDIFLVKGKADQYQRAASFLSMQAIMLVSVVAIGVTSRAIRGFLLTTLMVCLLLLATILIGGISQIIGSNSGLVVAAAVYATFLLFLFFRKRGAPAAKQENHNTSKFPLVWICQRVVLFFLIILGVFAVVFVSEKLGFVNTEHLDKLRIFNFGSGTLSSISSRATLIEDYYIEQLSYAPLLGNTLVDSLTTGTGTYAHSLLLSILTHQGVFGLLLFLLFITSVYVDISRAAKKPCSATVFQGAETKFFRLLVIGVVFLLATTHAFYTWTPFWFTIGILGLQFYRCSNTRKTLHGAGV